MIQMASRLALVMFVLWAITGLLETNHHANRISVASDALEHAVIAFGLVVLSAGALPRASLLVISLGVVAVGVAVEGLQGLAIVPGRFEPSDILADILGVVVAALAVSFGEARTAETQQAAAPGSAPQI